MSQPALFRRPTPRALRLVRMLGLDVWRCGRELDAELGWRFGAAVHEARQAGYLIDIQRCRRHYHQGRVYEYRRGTT